MNKKDKDYIFNIHWQDRYKNSYKVGLLAQINKIFYLIISGPKNVESAYKNGFVGIPGFQSGEVYKSQELFDFFKSRILLDDKTENPCEELVKSGGVSMIDSFSLEEVSERLFQKYREAILRAYEVQLKTNRQVKNNKESKVSEQQEIK